MYTAFYGLREKPFSLTPNPRFLYLTDAHKEALAHLLYGLEEGEGFIVLSGEVGVVILAAPDFEVIVAGPIDAVGRTVVGVGAFGCFTRRCPRRCRG